MQSIKFKNIFSLLKLAAPLIANNLAIAGIQVTDALMSSQLGSKELAAVAVGGSIWFLIFQAYNGLMMALSPIVARIFGERKEQMIGRYTRQACLMSLIIGVTIVIIIKLSLPFLLEIVGIDIEFRYLVVEFLDAIIYGAPGIFLFLVFRYTTEGIGFTRPVMYSSIIALILNILLNYILIFGNFGAPKLGVLGCGLASAISMWLVFIYLSSYFYLNKRYKKLMIFERTSAFRGKIMREILKLGIPISISVTAEAGLFSAVSIMIGTLGAIITSANQIALNVITVTFMIPLAISAATTVKVGQSLGEADRVKARDYALTGVFICGSFMLISSCILLLLRGSIIDIYTGNIEIKDLAMSLLLVAAVFQIVDGIQIGAAGALRGYKDTKIPMIVNLFSYWVLAFPLSYLLGIVYRLPPSYIWLGFVLGLSVAAILLTSRLSKISKIL